MSLLLNSFRRSINETLRSKNAKVVSFAYKNQNNLHSCSYYKINSSLFSFAKNNGVRRNYCQVKKSWLFGNKKFLKYDVVSLEDVGASRSVPNHISKPDYAETGVAEENETEICVLNKAQIEHMRQSCGLARLVLDEVSKHVKAGVSTDELDAIAHTTCVSYGAYPSPLNYRGFPKSICTSVNNIACHGVPDSRQLRNGDIISIDVSVYYNGYHGDCASSFCVGEVDRRGTKLVSVASSCLQAAIAICRPYQKFCEIGKAINQVAKYYGFSVVPAFCGHGIGSFFHGPPNILHFENEDDREMLEGMTFTIEPVICEGRPDIVILEDGWTASTEDNSRCAQFEHTILIQKNNAEILTVPDAFKVSE